MKAIYLWSACWSDKEIRGLIDLESTIIIYDAVEYSVDRKYIDSLRDKKRAFPTSSSDYLPNAEGPRNLRGHSREGIIDKVVNDFRLSQLHSRFKRWDTRSAFSFNCMCNDAVDYTLEFLDEFEITEILCSYTPHTFESFIFIRTLEICGVSVTRLSTSPLPWLVYAVNGLENLSPTQFREGNPLDIDAATSRVRRYFQKLNSDYENALPYYEVRNPLSLVNRLLSISSYFNLKSFSKWFLTVKAYKEFNQHVQDVSVESLFGIFFLHCQPEANTCPEAGIYYDQFQAIKKLSEAMPANMTLLVKEHPSTFTRDCDTRFRPKNFYARLKSIKNVKLCPLHSSTFDLIDAATFVSSISGMCMTEALARSIPVVVFNPLRFNGFPKDAVTDAYSSTLESLSNSLDAMLHPSFSFPKDEVFSSFVSLEASGYVSGCGDVFVPSSVSEQKAMSVTANRKAIFDF